jgi:hypothetical protein
MKSHQAVDVTEVVPTFFAQSGLSEYDSTTIKPNGYTLQGDNCHVYFSSPDLSYPSLFDYHLTDRDNSCCPRGENPS